MTVFLAARIGRRKHATKHAQIRDHFVVQFSSNRLKFLVEFKFIRAHYAGISEFHLSTETFGFSNNFFKNNSYVYYFVHVYSYQQFRERSKNNSFSASCVGEFQFLTFFHRWISRPRLISIQSQLISFYKISDTSYSTGTTNFLISTSRLFQKLSHEISL